MLELFKKKKKLPNQDRQIPQTIQELIKRYDLDNTDIIKYLEYLVPLILPITGGELKGKLTYSEEGLYSPNENGIYFDQYGNIHTKQQMNEGNWNILNVNELLAKIDWDTGRFYLEKGFIQLENTDEFHALKKNRNINGSVYSINVGCGYANNAGTVALQLCDANGNVLGRVDLLSNGRLRPTKGFEIPKDGSQGAGLTNTDGDSIIRDHNNQNVTIDATGKTLFLGYQNTTDLNILSGKITVDSNGNVTVGKTSDTITRNFKIQNNKHIGTFSSNSNGVMGIYSNTANKWLINIGTDGNGTCNVNAVSATKATNDGSNNNIVNTYLKKKNVVARSVSITPSAANTPTSKAVTWSAMDGTPEVVTTPSSTVVGTTVKGSGVSGVSSTGATIWLTRANTSATTVNYIAIHK